MLRDTVLTHYLDKATMRRQCNKATMRQYKKTRLFAVTVVAGTTSGQVVSLVQRRGCWTCESGLVDVQPHGCRASVRSKRGYRRPTVDPVMMSNDAFSQVCALVDQDARTWECCGE